MTSSTCGSTRRRTSCRRCCSDRPRSAAWLRRPVAPAAVSALARGVDIEAALAGLVARQLVDAVGDGRVVLHEVVRVDVLAQLAADERKRLSSAAAELVASTAAVSKGP